MRGFWLIKTNMVFTLIGMFGNGRFGDMIMVGVNDMFFETSLDGMPSLANTKYITRT
jgi:hypothetical protein